MFTPNFRITNKKVPILSKSEINNIAENFVLEYMPQIFQHPQPFNIDGFTESYHKLKLDYQYLSHNGQYLGMTIFNDTDHVIVYRPEYDCADYIHADCGTVIIDNSLLDDNQIHRYRFTLGHECGHWVFHKTYYEYNPNQLSLFDKNIADEPFIKCREINKNTIYENTNKWNEEQWMEWQADNFSACILMPKKALLMAFEHYGFDTMTDNDLITVVHSISKLFNVSEQAAYLRLHDLNILPKHDNNKQCKQLSLF